MNLWNSGLIKLNTYPLMQVHVNPLFLFHPCLRILVHCLHNLLMYCSIGYGDIPLRYLLRFIKLMMIKIKDKLISEMPLIQYMYAERYYLIIYRFIQIDFCNLLKRWFYVASWLMHVEVSSCVSLVHCILKPLLLLWISYCMLFGRGWDGKN